MQQWRKLQSLHHDNCNPRQHFWDDLQAKIHLFQTHGDKIIVMVNVNIDYDDEGFSTFAQDCHMIDSHEDLYTTASPATYTRGH
jgi:hypothetical protein